MRSSGSRARRVLAAIAPAAAALAAGIALSALSAAASPCAAAAPGAGADVRYRVYVSNEYGADITVIDPRTRSAIGTVHIGGRAGEVRPRGMRVSPDGRTVYVAVSDFDPKLERPQDRIVAIDVASNRIVADFWVGSNPERLAISRDGRQLWAANENAAQATGYDLATGELIGSFRTGIEPEGVAIHPDGSVVYVTGETSHSVSVIDARQRRTLRHFLVGNRPRDVAFSADGQRAYVSAEIGGTVSVVDVAQHKVIATIPLGLDSRLVEVALSPDGERLYVAGGGTNAIYVIDTRTLSLIRTVRERMGRRPWGVTVSPDGRTIYTADGLSDSVSIIDAQRLEVVGSIRAGRGPHSVVVGIVGQDPRAGGAASLVPADDAAGPSTAQRAPAVPARERPFDAHPHALQHAHALEMIGARLRALAALAPRHIGETALAALFAKAIERELPLVAGSLHSAEPALASALASALADVARQLDGGGAALAGALDRALAAQALAAHALLPRQWSADPAFVAAVVTRLLLADDGVADAYEDAMTGRPWEYPVGWAALQRVRTLLGDRRADAGIDEPLARLHALMPAPDPPRERRSDPEDAEEPSRRLVAALESSLAIDLHPDRELRGVAALAARIAGEGCAAAVQRAPALAIERLRISGAYFRQIERPLGVVDGELAQQVGALYRAAEDAPTSNACQRLVASLDRAGGALGGR